MPGGLRMAPAGADGPHVLLVENDEMVRGCLVDLLREAGLRVAVASSVLWVEELRKAVRRRSAQRPPAQLDQ